LLNDFWRVARLPVAGEIVAAIPARDFLVVSGSQDAEGVEKIRQIAETVASRAPYRLTSKLLVRRDGRFVLFEPKPAA